MNEKPAREWSDKELEDRQGRFPTQLDPLYGDAINIEIERRRARSSQRYTFWSVVLAAVAAFGSMLAAIGSLLVAFHYPK